MPRLPRSSPRNKQITFVKLLSRVDPRANTGFGFEGQFHRAGATVESLWPTPEYPQGTAIVLENAGSIGLTASGTPARGHNRAEVLYILWRYQDEVWTELGRAQSVSWHWALELRPLAVRALAEARRGHNPDVILDLEVVTARIARMLDREMEPLEPIDRGKVLGILHDQFAWRMADLQEVRF